MLLTTIQTISNRWNYLDDEFIPFLDPLGLARYMQVATAVATALWLLILDAQRRATYRRLSLESRDRGSLAMPLAKEFADGKLLWLNVGLPREVPWGDKTVRTAIRKAPVEGRRFVGKLNLEGDAQTDLAGNGGEQHAADRIHLEMFGARESVARDAAQLDLSPHLPAGPTGSGAVISFARSGISVAWNPQFSSLLELGEACDVPVRWSGQTGVRDACITGLIGGSIHYLPQPIERLLDGNVLVCCSRPEANGTLIDPKRHIQIREERECQHQKPATFQLTEV